MFLKKTRIIVTYILIFSCVLSQSLMLTSCTVKEEVPRATMAAEIETKGIEIEREIINKDADIKKSTVSETVDKRVAVDGMIRSFLTGEMVPVKQGLRRPLAIMMSNDKEAAPQYGINRAGVVYEAPVEGVMNRYMALIEDYDDLNRIGSVRSCRTYYTYFAREWDAVYAHFGQATFAVPYLTNVDNINGLELDSAYYRSKDKKAPHNAYTSGERINKAINALGYRSDYDPEYENHNGHFNFANADIPVNFEEALSWEAYKVVPGYPYSEPWFEYNENDGLYHRFQYGKKHQGNEGEISVKNIIFQYCATGNYATTDYLNINVHADGYGYYFTNGRVRPISSQKDGDYGVTRYYDMDGNEILLNPGKTWICIIRTDQFDKTEIFDKDGKLTNK